MEIPSWKSIENKDCHEGLILLTWINFNSNMDK